MRSRVRSWKHVNNKRRQALKRARRREPSAAQITHTRLFKATAADAAMAGELMTILGASIELEVHEAVEDQLSLEGRPKPHDPSKKMEDDYGYDDLSMDRLLTAVAKRLLKKKRNFSYNSAFVVTALGCELHDLKVKVAEKTK